MKQRLSAILFILSPILLALGGGVALWQVWTLLPQNTLLEPEVRSPPPVQMRLFVRPSESTYRPFAVTLYIRKQYVGEKVYLDLPPGLAFAPKVDSAFLDSARKTILPSENGRYCQVV